MCVVLHPNYCQILMKLEFFNSFRNTIQYQISWKSVQREPSFSMRAGGRADMKLIIPFRNFANAPKIFKIYWISFYFIAKKKPNKFSLIWNTHVAAPLDSAAILSPAPPSYGAAIELCNIIYFSFCRWRCTKPPASAAARTRVYSCLHSTWWYATGSVWVLGLSDSQQKCAPRCVFCHFYPHHNYGSNKPTRTLSGNQWFSHLQWGFSTICWQRR